MKKVIIGAIIYLIIAKLFEDIVNANVDSSIVKALLGILFFLLVVVIVSRIIDWNIYKKN